MLRNKYKQINYEKFFKNLFLCKILCNVHIVFHWSSPFLKLFEPVSHCATIHCIMAACFMWILYYLLNIWFWYTLVALFLWHNLNKFLGFFTTIWHFRPMLFRKNFLYVLFVRLHATLFNIYDVSIACSILELEHIVQDYWDIPRNNLWWIKLWEAFGQIFKSASSIFKFSLRFFCNFSLLLFKVSAQSFVGSSKNCF